jgi:hypothetical protein
MGGGLPHLRCIILCICKVSFTYRNHSSLFSRPNRSPEYLNCVDSVGVDVQQVSRSRVSIAGRFVWLSSNREEAHIVAYRWHCTRSTLPSKLVIAGADLCMFAEAARAQDASVSRGLPISLRDTRF